MGKRYEKASSDVEGRIAKLVDDFYHESLSKVTIGALFVYDTESSDPVLTHQGYEAAGLCRIVSARERASGLPDVQIILDRAVYSGLNAKQKNALIDHELYHIEPVLNEETNEQKYDAQDRPKLRIRKHDHQFGWFDEIANRHGEHSNEVRQAKKLIEDSGQLYFDFDQKKAA